MKIAPLLLGLMVCCTACTSTPSEAVNDTGDCSGQSPPTGCTDPTNPESDPLTRTDSQEPAGQSHLLHVEYDPASERVYASGIPGLVVARMEGSFLQILGQLNGKFEHLQVLDNGIVALTTRGRVGPPTRGGWQQGLKENGLYLYDSSDPSHIQSVAIHTFLDAGGMARNGDWLYVLSHDGLLRTLDINQPDAPTKAHVLNGLQNPWEMVVVDGLGYVADNTAGLVVVDLSQPEKPTVLNTLPTSGGAQDLVAADGHLYVAAGTAGVDVFSLDDPTNPTPLGTTELGGAIISVSVAGGLLWATNQERVLVVDATNPAALKPLAFENTPSWSMHVHAIGDRAFVADWTHLSVYDMDNSVPVAQADPSRSELYFTNGRTETAFSITNRGSAELILNGLTIDDDRVGIQVDTLAVAPGEEARVSLIFEDDGVELDTVLSMEFNDPNAPVQSIQVATQSSGSSVLVGEAAPNFNLPDTGGNYHELAAQAGHPVALIFFSPW